MIEIEDEDVAVSEIVVLASDFDDPPKCFFHDICGWSSVVIRMSRYCLIYLPTLVL